MAVGSAREKAHEVNDQDGKETVEDDAENAAARAPRAVPDPKRPSSQEVEECCLTHLAFRSWCVHFRAYETPTYKPLLWIFAVLSMCFMILLDLLGPWPQQTPKNHKNKLKTAKIQSRG